MIKYNMGWYGALVILWGWMTLYFPGRSLALQADRPVIRIDEAFMTERSLTTEEGLPANGVNDILQDSKGYIWAATYNGLVQYDGSRFRIYNSSTIDSLETNRFLQVAEGKNGCIWAGLEYNSMIRLCDGEAEVYYLDDEKYGFNNHIISLYPEDERTAWVGTSRGLFRFSGGTFRLVKTLPEQTVHQIRVRNGEVFVLFHRNLFRLSSDNAEAELLFELTEEGYIRSESLLITDHADPEAIYSYFDVHEDGIDLLTHTALYRIQPDSYEVTISGEEIGQNLLHGMTVSGQGNYIYGSNGIAALDNRPDGRTIARQISDLLITKAIVDREGSIWTATRAHGLRQFIGTPVYQGDRYRVLEDMAILATLEDREGNQWIGTNCEGLYRFSEDEYQRYAYEAGFENTCVWSLMEESDGTIWAGTWGGGLYRKPSESDRFERFEPEGLSDVDEILSIHEDKKGTIWIGTYFDGLFRYDGEEAVPVNQNSGETVSAVRMIYEDREGRLWLATERGIGRIEKGEVVKPEKFNILETQNFRTIARDDRGRFWFGSYGGGLLIYEEGNTPVALTEAGGLFDETVSQLQIDQNGNIWTGGNLGIFFIEQEQVEQFLTGEISTIRVSRLGTDEGLPIRETAGGFSPSGFLNSEGELMIPTVRGLAVIHTPRMTINRNRPNVLIEEAEIDGQVFKNGTEITLPHDTQRLIFRFTALSFVNPDYVRFQYKLDGVDDQWLQAGNVREAAYSTLPPGEYSFRVRAANNDGFWSEDAATFSFVVSPPFWQTGWFYLFGILGVAGLVYGIIRYRVRWLEQRRRHLTQVVDEQTARIRQEKERLEKAYHDLEKKNEEIRKSKQVIEEQAEKLKKHDEMKSHFFANISHELRTPLTIIQGIVGQAVKEQYGEINKQVKQELESVMASSLQLQGMIEQLLELSSLETGELALEKTTYSLNEQIKTCINMFRTLLGQKDLSVHTGLPGEEIRIHADKEKMETVLNHLMMNTVRNTPPGGDVEVELSLIQSGSGSWARIRVTDTRPAIPDADKPYVFDRFYQVTNAGKGDAGTGLSLPLVKEYVEMHGGQVVFASEAGQKTTFTVMIPALGETGSKQADETPAGEPVQTAKPEKENITSSTGETNKGKAKVLVVEDDLMLQKYMEKLLSFHYQVTVASDGEEGFRLAKKEMPDIIVSDIMMPKMDGFELCEKLHADPSVNYIPIVLLTARSGDESELRGLQGGADAYITKPFREEILLETLRNHIDSRKKLLKRFKQDKNLDDLLPVSEEDAFLEKLDRVIREHIDNPDITVKKLAEEMNVSQRQLQRKVSELTGLTPNLYLRKRRLETARHLLDNKTGSVSEIAYAVGFNSLSLFSSYFKEEFGVPPSKWPDQK